MKMLKSEKKTAARCEDEDAGPSFSCLQLMFVLSSFSSTKMASRNTFYKTEQLVLDQQKHNKMSKETMKRLKSEKETATKTPNIVKGKTAFSCLTLSLYCLRFRRQK